MRKIIGPVMLLFLVVEVVVAVLITINAPGGFGSLLPVNVGPERRRELPLQTFDLNTNGRVIVTNDNGAINITGSNTATKIEIKATQVARGNSDSVFDDLDFTVKQNGNDLVITANNRNEKVIFFDLGAPRTDIQITAPANIVTLLNTKNGAITLSNLDNSSARHEIRSENGRTTLSQVKAAYLLLSNRNGAFTLESFSGTLNAETDNGRISATNSTLNIERVKSQNGAIDLRGKLQQTGNGEISASNGSIRLRFEQLNQARYDVTTDNGNINLSGDAGLKIERQEKNHLIAGNGPTIRISTNNGSVTLEQGS